MTVEEVKKALMECRSPGKCDACPLKDNNDCMTLLKWDALNAIEELEERIGIVQESMEALEKRNESVEPIPPDYKNDLWKCGNCQNQLFRLSFEKYCPQCGKAVKWE